MKRIREEKEVLVTDVINVLPVIKLPNYRRHTITGQSLTKSRKGSLQ